MKHYTNDKTIHGLFEEQAAKTPDNIALVGMGYEAWSKKPAALFRRSLHLTYRQLNERVDYLVQVLKKKRVEPDTILGLIVERSVEMIIGILGILKAGCAYLPIDPKNPLERKKYIFKDSNTKLLLTTRNFEKEVRQLRNLGVEILFIEECRGEPLCSPGAGKDEFCCSPAAGTNYNASLLAYIIYTSGSTGKPKAVPITHANLSPLLHWGFEQLAFGPGDRAVQNLSYYFDWSVWEIFMALTSGAALFMVGDEILLNPQALADFIRQYGITILHLTPTQLQFLLEAGQPLLTLRYLVIGAEKLTLNLVEDSYELVNENCRLFNMYGPTEATIISAVLEIKRENYRDFKELASIPIGSAVANIDLLVLAEDMAACPANETGELFIAGDCLAAGYLNRPELTAEKFVSNYNRSNKSYRSYGSYFLEKLYKTGDLVRCLVDGNIEFLGRLDQQVKIRGFRIELGEIEKQLLDHHAVTAAVVMAREDRSGNKYLCAYIVAGDGAALSGEKLREYLSHTLPDYMIPARFVTIDSIPLNPNGKVDLKALPEPTTIDTGKHYSAPQNEIENTLVGIWSQILKTKKESIGTDEHFLEIGGHSLMATLVAAEIHKAFNIKIALEEFFWLSTIKNLARHIKEGTKEEHKPIPRSEKKEYYSLSPAQERLFIMDLAGVKNTAYNIPLVFALEEKPDLPRLEQTFRKLIARHESFRTSFHIIADEPAQIIHPASAVDFKVGYHEIDRAAGSREAKSAVRHLIRSFDLSQAPLLRAELVGQGKETYLLFVDMHHIVSDGISVEIFQNELVNLYSLEELSPPAMRYTDYAEWQENWSRQEELETQKKYWLQQFPGELPVLNLPLDYNRPMVQDFAGTTLDFVLDKEETEKLKEAARAENTTLYMALLAIFNILLAKLSGQEDIIVGTASAGRRHADLEDIIGMFIDTLTLRSFPNGQKSFPEFLREVKQTTLDAFANQDFQFEQLIDELRLQRDVGRNPLFSAMFVLQNMRAKEIVKGILKIKPYEYISTMSKFDLSFIVEEMEEVLSITVEYSTKLFKPGTIKRFIECFKEITRQVLVGPQKKLSDIEIITGPEKLQILEEFNHIPVEYPQITVVNLFNKQVAEKPDRNACFDEGNYLTYKNLNDRADVLANIIKEL